MTTFASHQQLELHKIQVEAIQRSLSDKDYLALVKERLAPCTPQRDYDRFEKWSRGFDLRLNRVLTSGRDRSFIKLNYVQELFEGWDACDRLLCCDRK